MKSDRLVIAFTCVGRRVQLVRHFRHACEGLGVEPHILGLDSMPSRAPAAYYCDEAIAVPVGGEPGFPQAILEIVASRRVGLLIPLADTDLAALANVREEVRRLGCLPACCGPQAVRISRDKLQTHRFLVDLGLQTPRTRLLAEALADRRDPLPAFVKPRFGSAGKSAFAIDTWQLPEWLVARAGQFVCQELLAGQEVTVDVFIDPDRRARCSVPRHRLEVRGGEVTKSTVRLDGEVASQAARIAEGLPDAFGVINIQGFIGGDGRVSWTEINPRFGGGSPLSIEAGPDLAGWLVCLALGRPPHYETTIADGLTMLRFDDAIYIDSAGGVCRGRDADAAGTFLQTRVPDEGAPGGMDASSLQPPAAESSQGRTAGEDRAHDARA